MGGQLSSVPVAREYVSLALWEIANNSRLSFDCNRFRPDMRREAEDNYTQLDTSP